MIERSLIISEVAQTIANLTLVEIQNRCFFIQNIAYEDQGSNTSMSLSYTCPAIAHTTLPTLITCYYFQYNLNWLKRSFIYRRRKLYNDHLGFTIRSAFAPVMQKSYLLKLKLFCGRTAELKLFTIVEHRCLRAEVFQFESDWKFCAAVLLSVGTFFAIYLTNESISGFCMISLYS